MLVTGYFDTVVGPVSRLSSAQQNSFRESVQEVQKLKVKRYGSQSESK